MTTIESGTNFAGLATLLPEEKVSRLAHPLSRIFENVVRSPLLSHWQPSERRRYGYLAARAYAESRLKCPTDIWSYQRIYAEQCRDAANLWAARPESSSPRVSSPLPTKVEP
jgi:hypothetical protein